jgi:hypothetical protein
MLESETRARKKNFKEDLTVNLPKQTSMFRVLRGVVGRNFRET